MAESLRRSRSPNLAPPEARVGGRALSDESLSPPRLPSGELCARCGLRLYDGLAEAVRAAVEAAFEDLRPALLRAVSLGEAGPGQAAKRRPRPTSPKAKPSLAPRPPELHRSRSSPWAWSHERVQSDEGRPPAEEGAGTARPAKTHPFCRMTTASMATPCDMVSRRSTNSAEFRAANGATRILTSELILPVGPPTVQSLEANIAHSLLEHSGFGPAVRGGPRPQRWSTSGSSGGSGRACIVPEPDGSRPGTMEAIDRANTMQSDDSLVSEPGAKLDRCESLMAAAGSTQNAFPPIKRTRMSSEQILAERNRALAEEATHSSIRTSVDIPQEPLAQGRAVPLSLLVMGVLPWDSARRPCRSAIYQWAVRLTVLSVVFMFFFPTGATSVCSSGRLCWQTGLASQLPLPVGTLLVSMQFMLRRQQEALEETFRLLHDISVQRGYKDWLLLRCRMEKAAFVLMWCAIIIFDVVYDKLYLVDDIGTQTPARLLQEVSAIGLFSGVILCVTHAMVHICHSLSTMVDAFCCEVASHILLYEVAYLWNLTQATLRRSSNAIDHCLLTLFIVLVFTVPCLLIDGGLLESPEANAAFLVASIMVTCGILYALLLAATISEKCARVPALINAISFGEGTEGERQATVDYVTSSAAGFYVFGMRLTTGMVAKLIYVWCMVAVGTLTKLASAGGHGGVSFGMGV